MPYSHTAITALGLIAIAFTARAETIGSAAPILFDASTAAIEAQIDETPIPATTRTQSVAAPEMDASRAAPVAIASKLDSNKVAAVDLDEDGVIRLGTNDIDIRAGTLEDVAEGAIIDMRPATEDARLALNEDVKPGDFYYGADGNVYRFIGATQ